MYGSDTRVYSRRAQGGIAFATENTAPLNAHWEALASVAQWIERWPENQRVAGSIPSQSTSLGCRPGPWWRAHERQPHMDISLPLFLPPFFSL